VILSKGKYCFSHSTNLFLRRWRQCLVHVIFSWAALSKFKYKASDRISWSAYWIRVETRKGGTAYFQFLWNPDVFL